jgi:hypothetical protein
MRRFFERFHLSGEPQKSEFLRVDEAAQVTNEIMGFPGAMLSGSKSDYSRRHPDHKVVYNANVGTKRHGKLWHGDLDLSIPATRTKLSRLAAELKDSVYVLYEFDWRFECEDDPRFERAAEVFEATA